MSRARAICLTLLLSSALAPLAEARAGAELGPNRWGLPGLGQTTVVPETRGAPLRLGLWGDTATLDAEHGIDVNLGTQDLTSRSLRFQLGVRAARNVLLSASLPYRFVSLQDGESFNGIGDLEIGGVVRWFSVGRTAVGAWGIVRVPTGDEAGLSTQKLEGEYGLTTTARFFEGGLAPELRWHLNLGYRLNKNENDGYAGAPGLPSQVGAFFPSYPAVDADEGGGRNDQLLIRSAVEFQRSWGHLFLELSTDWFVDDPDISFRENHSWFTPGIHLGHDDGVSLTAAWAIGLFADDPDTDYEPRLPDWHLQVGVSMPIFLGGRDRDDDFVPDSEDACPDEPEDIDGFADEDGCPDLDNDGDGVIDALDLAPDLMEDFDGFEDEDGRPDLDNDGDGIPDTQDRCPLRAEDFDGFEDDDGCPDVVLDADGDGILDGDDDCPQEPEDFDGFEDDDGCPELDNDLDGILDADDACPDQAENYDGIDDEDGCPEDAN